MYLNITKQNEIYVNRDAVYGNNFVCKKSSTTSCYDVCTNMVHRGLGTVGPFVQNTQLCLMSISV